MITTNNIILIYQNNVNKFMNYNNNKNSLRIIETKYFVIKINIILNAFFFIAF